MTQADRQYRAATRNYQRLLKERPAPPAVCTDLQRLDSRLSEATYRLAAAHDELHAAEVAHRLAVEAVDAELARLESDRGDDR